MNLYEKINAVMNKIEYLSKDATVSLGSNKGVYKAISEEKVTSAVREALIEFKLVILPVEREVKCTPREYKNSYGTDSVNYFAETNTKYKIVNCEDPKEYEIISSAGEGLDNADKAIGKALTYDYKYLLLRTFAIPTGLDPDIINNENNPDNQEELLLPKSQEIPIEKLQENIRQMLILMRNDSVAGYESNETIQRTLLKEIKVNNVSLCKDRRKLEEFEKKMSHQKTQQELVLMLAKKGYNDDELEQLAQNVIGCPLSACFDDERLIAMRKEIMKLRSKNE